MDRYKLNNQASKSYTRVGLGRNARGAFDSASAVSETEDWDEFDEETGARPTQFALCACMYAIFGMKTSAQALYDTRVQLRKLITMKAQNFNTAQFRFNRANEELLFYKKKRDVAGAKVALASKKSAEQRMENNRRAMLNFEEKLNALEDVNDSKESTEALKAIGQNMKHLNLPKRLNDAEKAYAAIDQNRFDMEELQSILKPSPVYDSGSKSQITDEELEAEVIAMFNEEDDEESVDDMNELKLQVPRDVPKMNREKLQNNNSLLV